ncbi:uncharacterized protein DEA37_0011364, partial [Paragonimus westermani]
VGPFGGTSYAPIPMVLDQMGHLTGPQVLCLSPNSQHVPLKHSTSHASNPVCEGPRYVPMPQLIMVTTPVGSPMTHHTLVPSSNHGPSTTFTGPMPTQTPFVPPIAYSPPSQPVPPTRGQSLYAGHQYINTPMLPYKSRKPETTDSSRYSKRIASRSTKTSAEPSVQESTYKPAAPIGHTGFKHVQDVGCAVQDSVCSQRHPTVSWTPSVPLPSTLSQTVPHSPNVSSYCSLDDKTTITYGSSKPRTTHRSEQRQKARELYAALKHRLSSTLTTAKTSDTTTITSRTALLNTTGLSCEKQTAVSSTPFVVIKPVSASNKRSVSSPTTPVHDSAFYTRSSVMLNSQKRVPDRDDPKAAGHPESTSLDQCQLESANNTNLGWVKSHVKSNDGKPKVCLQTACTHGEKVTERRETSEPVQCTSAGLQMINPPNSVHSHNPILTHDPTVCRNPSTSHVTETRNSFEHNQSATHFVCSSEPQIMHSLCGYQSDGGVERDKARHTSESIVATALSSSMPPQNFLPEDTASTLESSIQSLPRHLRFTDQTNKEEHRPDTLSLNPQNLTTYTKLMQDRIQEGMRAAQESLNLSCQSNVSSSSAEGRKVETQKCRGASSGQTQTRITLAAHFIDHKADEQPAKPSVNSVSDSEDWYYLHYNQKRRGDSMEVTPNMNPHNTLPLSQRNSGKCWDRSQAVGHASGVEKGLSLTAISTKPTPDTCSTQRHASVDETQHIYSVSSFKPSHYRQQIGNKHVEPRVDGTITAKSNGDGTLSAPPSTPIKLPYAPPASLIAATVDLQRMRIAEVEGSNLSLTSNLSRTSTIHLLRRKLRAAEDQIIDLTSQLASSVSVSTTFVHSSMY